MLTLMLGTVILAVTYGAFWHNQPARPPSDQKGDAGFRLGRLVNRALEWLALMPHLSNPVEKKDPVFHAGKGVIPDREPGFFRQVLRAFLMWNPWHRILVDHAGMRPSIHADLFKP